MEFDHDRSNHEDAKRRLTLGLHVCGAAIALLISAAAYFWQQHVLEGERETLEGRLRDELRFAQLEEKIDSDAAELSSRVDDTERRLAEALDRVPEQPDEFEFLGQISELAQNTGVTIRDYRPGEIRKGATTSELAIQLSAEANYANLCRFLSGLNSTRRLCRLTAMEVSTPGQLSAVYPVELTIAVFFASTEKQGTGAESDDRENS